MNRQRIGSSLLVALATTAVAGAMAIGSEHGTRSERLVAKWDYLVVNDLSGDSLRTLGGFGYELVQVVPSQLAGFTASFGPSCLTPHPPGYPCGGADAHFTTERHTTFILKKPM